MTAKKRRKVVKIINKFILPFQGKDCFQLFDLPKALPLG